ncbi:MAG: hypothetical protein E7370_02715 [Clostridiales bacterium]|nr:hypothetical protein [Clostridiales bacterium]
MNKHKKFNSILFRIAFVALMLVLFSTHLSAGIAAKFISSAGGSDEARVARFSCSTNIDDYSALTFTNTAFWGGAYGDSGVAMNALRSVNFSVHNWDYADESKTEIIVNEVASSYELNFSAPANFIEKLAIQVFDDQDHPLMPQFGFHDLIETFHESADTDTTASYTAPAMAKYNGKLFHHDVDFTVTRKANTFSEYDYVAVSNTNGLSTDGLTVKLTKFKKTVDQTLYFRLWDVSHLTTTGEVVNRYVKNEMGKLLAPLKLVLNEEIEFYKISVSLPSFVLKTNEAETKKYKIQIAPTHALFDDHLGAELSVSTASTAFDYINATPITKGSNIGATSWMETIEDRDTSNHVISHNVEAVVNPKVPTDVTMKNVSTVTETLTEDVTLHGVKENGVGETKDVVIPKGSVVEIKMDETQVATEPTVDSDNNTNYYRYWQDVTITTQKTYVVTTDSITKTYVYNSTQTVTRTIVYENHNLNITPTKVLVPSFKDGALEYEDGAVKYVEVGSFDLFETVGGIKKQKYFVSECYSKNYPMTVSVTFTQID